MPWRGRAREARVPRAFDANRSLRRGANGVDDAEDDAPRQTRHSRATTSYVVSSPPRDDERLSDLFAGATFYFDGYVPEGASVVRTLAERHGGRVALAWSKTAKITHYVVEDYGCMDEMARDRHRRGKSKEMRCVRSSWIMRSIDDGRLVEDYAAHAPRGTPRASPKKSKREAALTEMDLVDLIIDTAWNGTGGVSTQKALRETWVIRVIFDRVVKVMQDGRTKDADVRLISFKAYNALKQVVHERWIVPVSASEALVHIEGTKNIGKRNNFVTSQSSPTDAAQALEWIMVDEKGVNVTATMHDVRSDGWDPSWLTERASADASVGVVTRRASRAAAASQDEQDLRTLSQLSNIDPEDLEALDPQTRYEWSKARADRENQRLQHRNAANSSAFQLLKACGSGKAGKAIKTRRPAPVAASSPAKRQMTTRKGAQRAGVKKSAQMPITAYASPVKEKGGQEAARRSCVGEPVMASTSVHTATLLHALERVLSVDAQCPVDDRVDVVAEIVRLHIEELAHDGRRQEVRAVRCGLENLYSDHPSWVAARANILTATASLAKQ